MRARLQIGCDSLPRVCAKGEGPSFARLQPKLRSILRENHEQHARTPRALRKRKLDFHPPVPPLRQHVLASATRVEAPEVVRAGK